MRLQEKYGFKARAYHAQGFEDLAAYKKVHGSDLFIRDVEEYDRICKVCDMTADTCMQRV